MAYRARWLATIPLLLSATACGTSLRVTPFAPGQHPPRPPEHPVQMFSTKTPECPYDELGLLRAEPRTGLVRWQQVVDDFLARVRQMGGDAALLRQVTEIRASSEGTVVEDDVLSGTVIRFRSADCQR